MDTPTGKSSITCTSLPDSNDVLKQQAYKWDTTTNTWIYSEDKHTSILEDYNSKNSTYDHPTLTTLYSQVQYLAMMEGVDL